MFGGFKALWFGPRCSLLHAIPKPGDLNEYGKVAKFSKVGSCELLSQVCLPSRLRTV